MTRTLQYYDNDTREPGALLTQGFVYRGYFHGRANMHTGWRNVAMPLCRYLAFIEMTVFHVDPK